MVYVTSGRYGKDNTLRGVADITVNEETRQRMQNARVMKNSTEK